MLLELRGERPLLAPLRQEVGKQRLGLRGLVREGRAEQVHRREPGERAGLGGERLVVVQHLAQQSVGGGVVRVHRARGRELGSLLHLAHDVRLRHRVHHLGGVRVRQVHLRLERLGGGERGVVQVGDGARLDEANLQEVRGAVLHGERHLRVGDAEDAVPRQKELRLRLAERARGDVHQLLELPPGLEVGVLVAELDALAEQPATDFDVRVGGVGILQAELRAEVAQRLGLPALHGVVAHGDDGHQVRVVQLGDALGALLGHVLHAELGADGVNLLFRNRGGVAVHHAVPQRLGRGRDALLVRGGDRRRGGGAEPSGEHGFAGVAAHLAADAGADGEPAADNRGIRREARAAQRRLLLLELVHFLLERVRAGARVLRGR